MSIKTLVKTIENQRDEQSTLTSKSTELLSSHSSFFNCWSASPQRTRDRLRHRRQQMRKLHL